MNVFQLKEILKTEGIAERYYLLDGKGVKEDKICIELVDEEWQVYYSERGKKYSLATYANESDACDEVLLRLQKKCRK